MKGERYKKSHNNLQGAAQSAKSSVCEGNN